MSGSSQPQRSSIFVANADVASGLLSYAVEAALVLMGAATIYYGFSFSFPYLSVLGGMVIVILVAFVYYTTLASKKISFHEDGFTLRHFKLPNPNFSLSEIATVRAFPYDWRNAGGRLGQRIPRIIIYTYAKPDLRHEEQRLPIYDDPLNGQLRLNLSDWLREKVGVDKFQRTKWNPSL